MTIDPEIAGRRAMWEPIIGAATQAPAVLFFHGGGGMAAALTILARERSGPKIARCNAASRCDPS